MHFSAVVAIARPTQKFLQRAEQEGFEITWERANVCAVEGKAIRSDTGYPRLQIPEITGENADPSIIAYEEVVEEKNGTYYQAVSSLSGKKLIPVCDNAEVVGNRHISAKFMVGAGLILGQAYPEKSLVRIVSLRIHLLTTTEVVVGIDGSNWVNFADINTLHANVRPVAHASVKKIGQDPDRATFIAPPKHESHMREGVQDVIRKEERARKRHSHRGGRPRGRRQYE